MDVEATRSIRQAEVGSTKAMLKRVKAKFDLHPEGLIADTCGANDEFLLAGTAQNLRKLAKILPAPQQVQKA